MRLRLATLFLFGAIAAALSQDMGSGINNPSSLSGGGGGTPGGSNGQVQINNAGAFGGITNTQLTALINAATASLPGALPAWPNNTTTFFRGDGTYATLNVAAVAGAAPLASPTFTGTPAAPTAAAATNTTQLATTAFVTTAVANAIAGVNPAVAVQAATTQASDTSGLTYNNGVAGVGATFTGSVNTAFAVDGFTFTALNQRVLIKNDTQSPSGAFNGIYYVTQLQTGILPPILTRALDYDQPSDMNNTGAIPVVNGTVNGTTSWLLTSAVATVGTDPLTYTKFSVNPNVALPISGGGTNATTLAGAQANLEIGSLLFTAAAVNFNSANTDTPIAITLPTGFTRYNVRAIALSGASASISTATFALFTGAGGTGGTIAGSTAITVTSSAENTANNSQITQGFGTINTNVSTLFFRVLNAQGSAATANVTIQIFPLS